ncbi:chromosome segregation atpase [Fusarium circinatum]|uniref:Chromosome segregation atpase n=1 Tax=Fusarium circinatum TaxID=48490 RepID=A0A8H5SRN9_FUSCI|nr:chromosome segregation atpase [Fusarium circinatum]
MQLSYALLLVATASSVLARRLVITPVKLFSGNDVYIYSNDGTEHAIKDSVPIDGCKYNRGSIGECCVDILRQRAHFKYKGQSTKYCFKFHNKTGTGKDTRFIYGEAGCSCFGIDIIMDTTDVLKFGSVRSGPPSMGIEVEMEVRPKLQIGGYLYINVAEQPDPLKLKLELKDGAVGVDGSAAMIGKWNNPRGKCKQLEIANLFTKPL